MFRSCAERPLPFSLCDRLPLFPFLPLHRGADALALFPAGGGALGLPPARAALAVGRSETPCL